MTGFAGAIAALDDVGFKVAINNEIGFQYRFARNQQLTTNVIARRT